MWQEETPSLRVILLTINTFCFGCCLVLLMAGAMSGPLILLTVGTGLCAGAGLAGVLMNLRQER